MLDSDSLRYPYSVFVHGSWQRASLASSTMDALQDRRVYPTPYGLYPLRQSSPMRLTLTLHTRCAVY